MRPICGDAFYLKSLMKKNIIHNEDCLTGLKKLPDNSVDCCISSPPYWGLRDYGVDGQVGNEHDYTEFIDKLSEIYQEVYRVLKPEGTCFINLGDTYGGSGSGTTKNADTSEYIKKSKQVYVLPNGTSKSSKFRGTNLDKSLLMIPERFALEMINKGWILRNQLIWHKPNQMPSSATDRFTVDFEKIFFFVKQSRGYYFEQQFDPYTTPTNRWAGDNLEADGKSDWDEGTGQKTYRNRNTRPNPNGKNMRTVWSINTKPFPDAHFAIFPQKLVERMIKSGCPEYICSECNTNYKRTNKIDKNLTLKEVEEIKKKIIRKTNEERKPYAIVEKEFRKQIIEYRNLPNHNSLKEYLQKYKNKSNLTIEKIESYFGTQAPHHWFEKNGSFPDKNDWLKLKELLNLDDTFDKSMTEVFYKSGIKGVNNYSDNGFVKQCECKSDETYPGIVLDPFMGAGTTAVTARKLKRNYIGFELNKEYIKMANNRLYKELGMFL